MCGPILALLIIVPAVELFTLFKVGAQLGFFPTMLIVVGTAFFGIAAARGQGFAVLERLRRGDVPVQAEVLDGPLLFVAAGLLLFPGFISDALGLLLLVPPLRRLVARRLTQRMGPGGMGPGGDPTVIIVDAASVRTRPTPGPGIDDQTSP